MKVTIELDLDNSLDLKAYERLVGYTTPTPPAKTQTKSSPKKTQPKKEEPAAEDTGITPEQLKEQLRKFAKANGGAPEGVNKAYAIMEKLGGTNSLSDFPKEKYADLLAALSSDA